MNLPIEKLHFRDLNIQHTTLGLFALFICSFADASIFPAPVLTIFILLVLANNQKADKYVILATSGTFLGAISGYFLGYIASLNLNEGSSGYIQYIYEHVPGFSKVGLQNIQLLYEKWNFGILFMASFSPIPFGLFSLPSGIFKINLPVFCLTTVICQTSKFWLLSVVAKKMGPKVKELFGWKPLHWVFFLLLGTIVIYYFI